MTVYITKRDIFYLGTYYLKTPRKHSSVFSTGGRVGSDQLKTKRYQCLYLKSGRFEKSFM